jgi:hypothetical protein
MNTPWSAEWALVLLFSIHLIAFGVMTWRRRTWQLGPAMVTFAVLVALNLLKAVDLGGDGLHDALRGSAYLGLSLSVALWARRRWLNP